MALSSELRRPRRINERIKLRFREGQTTGNVITMMGKIRRRKKLLKIQVQAISWGSVCQGELVNCSSRTIDFLINTYIRTSYTYSTYVNFPAIFCPTFTKLHDQQPLRFHFIMNRTFINVYIELYVLEENFRKIIVIRRRNIVGGSLAFLWDIQQLSYEKFVVISMRKIITRTYERIKIFPISIT